MGVISPPGYLAVKLSHEVRQAALESRAVIDQAKGLLMERHKVTADQRRVALDRQL